MKIRVGNGEVFPNPNAEEVDINQFNEPADTLIEQAIPNPMLEEVDIILANAQMEDNRLFADIDFLSEFPTESDFPTLDMVNEVIEGDVTNLDDFNDAVLGKVSDSPVNVQGPVPSDEIFLSTESQPLDMNPELNVDMATANTSLAPLTPFVLLVDNQMFSASMPLQMPQQNGLYGIAPQGIQQNGLYGIAPQGIQLITLPAQNAVTVIAPPPAAVTESVAGSTATAAGPSRSSTPASSKRKQVQECEGTAASKKQKLYQAQAFADPQMEKKRQNAINAKNHRDKTKLTIKELEQKLANVSQDCDNIAHERDEYIREIEELRRENLELRKQTEEAQKKYQKVMKILHIMQQQRKCGVPQAHIKDFLS